MRPWMKYVCVAVVTLLGVMVFHKSFAQFRLRVPEPITKPTASSNIRLHVISSMPVLKAESVKTDSYKGLNPKAIDDRMEEFVTAVQRTLNHPMVENVHCLYDKPEIISYLNSHIKSNLTKLLFHKVGNARQSNTAFIFAYTHLKGKVVMINPADVYPGEGFELINRDTMAKKKIFYALTRWGRVEKNCDMRKQASSNSCDDKRYMGSHDSYMFVPTEQFPNKTMHELDVLSQDYGVENMIIWAYKTIEKYKVMNPCKTVRIYHIHCSNVRDAKRKRINTSANTGLERPTDRLE